MINGILKSQFGSVFWYHELIVFLTQHKSFGLAAGRARPF